MQTIPEYKNLKGNGVKVGIVEMGYPDKTNLQLTGRSITFDIPIHKPVQNFHMQQG